MDNRRMLVIPPDALQPDTLRALVEEFVTRHGTELSDAEDKVSQVRRLLRTGDVQIVFDDKTETANIVPKDYKPEPLPGPPPLRGGPSDEAAFEPAAESRRLPRRPRAAERPYPGDESRRIVYDEPPPPSDD